MSLKGLDQNIWNKFDRELNYIWGETCRVLKMTISHLFLRLKMFRKFPEAFVEEGSCRAPSAFPKPPPSEGSCHQRPELEGYWIFLIIVRSDHWPAWRSPCHHRWPNSREKPQGLQREEMPPGILDWIEDPILGKTSGHIQIHRYSIKVANMIISLSSKRYSHQRFTGVPPCLMMNR